MIEKTFLEKLAVKTQTSFGNILREYFQHVFLRSFYNKKGSENFLFKGGTALRLVFGSPRFSEDLDFSGKKNSGSYESILEAVLIELTGEGMEVDLSESKATSGGHIASIKIEMYDQWVEIQNHLSFRSGKNTFGENIIIVSEIAPSYNIFLLNRKLLITERLMALLERSKPRDLFDLYFILRSNELRGLLLLNEEKKKKLLAVISKQQKNKIAVELKNFLPKSYWLLVKDLPLVLEAELNRM